MTGSSVAGTCSYPDSDRPKSRGPLPEADAAKLQEDFWAEGDGA
jgi:hypothetical protein